MARVRERSDQSKELDDPDITIHEHESRLRELPPSAKLVAKVLEEQAMEQQTIAEESLLPDRTVRYALGRLEEADVVTSRISLTDARKEVYRLRQPVTALDSDQ